MMKQPELPDFYRDLEIVQSLNRPTGSTTEGNQRLDATELQEVQDVPPT